MEDSANHERQQNELKLLEAMYPEQVQTANASGINDVTSETEVELRVDSTRCTSMPGIYGVTDVKN
jgi:hypothetical protein